MSVLKRMFSSGTQPLGEGNWRVGHIGRDAMFYEELRDGKWERLEISGEMLTG